jgi:hypothetical protein
MDVPVRSEEHHGSCQSLGPLPSNDRNAAHSRIGEMKPGCRTIRGRRAGIAQSVQRLATGWTAEGSEFESRWGQEFSLLHIVQTGSAAHPTSYAVGTGGSVPVRGVKRLKREADHSHVQLVPRLRKYGSIHPLPRTSSWRSA